MIYHELAQTIKAASFTILGAFHPEEQDAVPGGAKTLVLIGNAGPRMWHRFVAERAAADMIMDEWTVGVLIALADEVGGAVLFPFAKPPLPFLRWAQKAKAGFVSPLGLNIHPEYGVWHAFRGALCLTEELELPASVDVVSPCETCEGKPCLGACPVTAFDGQSYKVDACAQHIARPDGQDCLTGGCKARHACPIGEEYRYLPEQAEFHMSAFLKARSI